MDGNTLVAFLRQAVSNGGELPEEIDWEELIELARLHHVEPMVCHVVRKKRLPIPDRSKDILNGIYSRRMFLEVQQDYTMGMIRTSFCEARIPHVLLRGALLKRDYPSSDMRTMSDLDYLVRVEDYPRIKKSAEKLGGRHIHTDGGHFSFLFPPEVMVEFHPNLIYAASPVGTEINPGWQYTRIGSGPYDLELTEEGFYLNMICHMAYHFTKGGTGVRSVLDLWIYRHRHTPQPDKQIVERELERAGLRLFAEQMEALAEMWFGTGQQTSHLEELGRYVLTSGAHGVEARAVLNAACFSPGGNGCSALLSRAFYPREELENRFPWSRGRPWLLPAAWCVRAFWAVTQHPGHILRWGRAAQSLSEQELKEQRERLRRFGFQMREREKRT